MNKIKLVIISYCIAIIGFFLYSYTQVDLSLTLSRISAWQIIEKSFQYIGYFQRPLSGSIYCAFLVLLFGSYLGLLWGVKNKKISSATIWKLIIFTVVLLTFSYNGFSYDLFNYIFDAKIITHYHLNPYQYKALDFPQDPMLSFMHWTQRTYPYGPVWIFLTLPFSYLGFQLFLPTLFLFKSIESISVLGTAFFIQKIMKKVDPAYSLLSVTFFAFSPLVVIEGLISAHNDMSMIFLVTLSLYLLIEKKYIRSIFMLVVSAGIKFATITALPLFLFVWKQKKISNWTNIFFVGVLLGILPIVAASLRTNFQPWYVLYLFPFAALLAKKSYVLYATTFFSFAALLEYLPFLLKGDWNTPVPTILLCLTAIGLIGAGLIAGVCLVKDLVVKKSHAK